MRHLGAEADLAEFAIHVVLEQHFVAGVELLAAVQLATADLLGLLVVAAHNQRNCGNAFRLASGVLQLRQVSN